MASQNSQWIDWSIVQAEVSQWKNSFNPSNEKQKQKNYPCFSIFQCCLSVSPLVQGLLLGILSACVLLIIALVLLLSKLRIGTSMITTTGQAVTTTTARMATTTVTYIPTGIYALTISLCATWNHTGITIAGQQNGTAGPDLGSLDTPVSIFVDNNDILYIADRENNRAMKYYPNTSIGIIVGGNSSAGDSPQQLNNPRGVAVDQSGAVIVADSFNYRIQKFNINSTIGITLFANTSTFPLGQTRDLHIDVNNNIYITDSDNNQVVKFTPYSPTGIVLAGSNGPGSTADQLSVPYGNFMTGNNTLYVADSGNHRIMKYLPGSRNGTVVAGITAFSGSSLNQLSSPRAVIVDNNEFLYVADTVNNRIVKWTTNYASGGTCVVGCTGIRGNSADQLNSPRDLKFDKYGNLYVSDQGNNRVQKFEIQTPILCPISG